MDADTNSKIDKEQSLIRKADGSGYADYDRDGLGDVVEKKYNDGLKKAGSRLWHGTQQVGSSSFGKWAMITAVAVVGVMALVAGAMGAGWIGGLAVKGTTITSMGGGMVEGAGKALSYLMHPMGWATVIAGGIIGSVADNRAKSRISANEAEQLARDYASSRQRERAQQQAPEVPLPKDTRPAQTQAPVTKPVAAPVANEIPTDGYVAGELKRRAMKNPSGNQLQLG